MAERIWLDVPYNEKDQAKAAGARWDPHAKRWYAPRPGIGALHPWAARPAIPALLPGEDRSFGAGLFVDVVPSSCWFTNVRTCVSQRDWERLRRMLLDRAGHLCEICGRGEDRAAERWLEAHERWAYDERRSVQALRRLICLCTDCHRTTHFGLARVKGRADQAFEHLCAVTGMTPDQADSHVQRAFAVWEQRSTRTWTLDLSMLTDAGVTLADPPGAGRRSGIAADELVQERNSGR
ncbi:DUF5710 domain-containing protein [Streptomonospora salina]|uniref:DUF5710 domain-containing protein n=1 Tax=Streptomonospora salina TaxID=104205 RepID=A0A841E768_9ACTN|nr:DUF5710 domain-containing protein [Streptomonospora salina]MBB5998856.1 hypothetical protein [Streptomonospora salina]